MPFPERISLSDNIFILLRDLIHERTGVYYDISKQDILADRLAPRLFEKGLDSFLDYYYLLKYDVTADEEWKYVMDCLAVLETFFYREFDQIQALVNILVPEYFARNTKEPLRIWSAACATGEEPLTIAIALNEAGLFNRFPIEIYATDASHKALVKARTGIYRERSFRNFSPALQAKYFTETHQGNWQICPEILHKIKWATVNLVVPYQVSLFANSSIIFCRNVFIYFSDASIRQTVNLFYEKMPIPGYLFIGASESLLKLSNDFKLQEINGAFVYVKN